MCVNILIWGYASWLLVNSHNSVFIMKISTVTRWLLLKEINPEYSLEGLMLMLMLKLQYFSHEKNWCTRKDPDAGKDWRQKEKGTAEDKMVRQLRRLNGHESEQTLGDSGQRKLTCCSTWSHKELTWLSDWTSITTGKQK